MSEKRDIYGIIGAGGFGREVMPVARQTIENHVETKDHELVFVVENLEEESEVNGHRVISMADFIAAEAENKYFNIAIADYQPRERIVNDLIAANIKPFTIKATNAVILDNNQIGEGAILCPFTTITSNAKIGKYFHSNIYSYVAHDCVVGDYVTFAPNVHCNGGVVIEDYAYIGTDVVIKQSTKKKPVVIGKGAVVGMGAVVTKSVPPYTTVIGNPAVEFKRK